LFQSGAGNITKEDNIMYLKNFMEYIVLSQLKDMLEKMDVCKCERCRMDIAALALNNLPPKYVVSDKGELYSKIDSITVQFEADVIAAITKAAKTVKEKPNH